MHGLVFLSIRKANGAFACSFWTSSSREPHVLRTFSFLLSFHFLNPLSLPKNILLTACPVPQNCSLVLFDSATHGNSLHSFSLLCFMLHDNIIILCVLKERWSACQHLWSDNFQHKNDINIFFCSCYKHQIYISHAKFNVLIKLLFFFLMKSCTWVHLNLQRRKYLEELHKFLSSFRVIVAMQPSPATGVSSAWLLLQHILEKKYHSGIKPCSNGIFTMCYAMFSKSVVLLKFVPSFYFEIFY